MRLFRLAAALILVALATLPARAFETQASAAWVKDLSTGTILLNKQADTPMPPASMSKLMTLNMLFEALRDGRVSMDTRFGVSERAAAMTGSTMYLDTRDRPTVEELVQGIIVMSGNDACVTVAEGLAGSEAAFAKLMTERAQELGMVNSHFANASGWPDPGQRMSMHDLGILAERLLTEFPEYYKFFSIKEFPFDNRAPQNRFNRNPLLGLGIGADGLKTGHTQEAGYGLVGSAKQGGRRIVFVISGMPTEAARADEAERVVNWAFRQFVQRSVAEDGQVLGQADVWMGDTRRVDIVAPDDITMLIPATHKGPVTGDIVYDGPLEAPIAKGDTIAHLVINLEGMGESRQALVAGSDVERGGFVPRLRAAASVLGGKAMAQVSGLRGGTDTPEAPAEGAGDTAQ